MFLLARQTTLLSLSFQPFIWKQLVQFASAVAHDPATYVFQISAGIDVKGSTGLDQGEKSSRCPTTFFTSKEVTGKGTSSFPS